MNWGWGIPQIKWLTSKSWTVAKLCLFLQFLSITWLSLRLASFRALEYKFKFPGDILYLEILRQHFLRSWHNTKARSLDCQDVRFSLESPPSFIHFSTIVYKGFLAPGPLRLLKYISEQNRQNPCLLGRRETDSKQNK